MQWCSSLPKRGDADTAKEKIVSGTWNENRTTTVQDLCKTLCLHRWRISTIDNENGFLSNLSLMRTATASVKDTSDTDHEMQTPKGWILEMWLWENNLASRGRDIQGRLSGLLGVPPNKRPKSQLPQGISRQGHGLILTMTHHRYSGDE